MDIDKARAIAADVLVRGVMTEHRLPEVREARMILELEGLMFKDARLETGACLILDMHLDILTTHTTEV
jgi:hypothetical protein